MISFRVLLHASVQCAQSSAFYRDLPSVRTPQGTFGHVAATGLGLHGFRSGGEDRMWWQSHEIMQALPCGADLRSDGPR